MKAALTQYYDQRAKEYEAIYAKPERQADLKKMAWFLQDLFKAKNVLEIACGTGYWTPIIAASAQSVLATDINESVLEIARAKAYPSENVVFKQADLYTLTPSNQADALFGGFIWSHIKREDWTHFVEHLNTLIKPGGRVVFADNRYVPGSSTPISEYDDQGNSYQTRALKDGSTHKVLKNFPEPSILEDALRGKSTHFQYFPFEFYWICSYQTLNPATLEV